MFALVLFTYQKDLFFFFLILKNIITNGVRSYAFEVGIGSHIRLNFCWHSITIMIPRCGLHLAKAKHTFF